MVHAFRAHDENVLRRIEQPNAGPDRSNPEPSLRSGPNAKRVHTENRILQLPGKANNAANRRDLAVGGLAVRNRAARYCYL